MKLRAAENRSLKRWIVAVSLVTSGILLICLVPYLFVCIGWLTRRVAIAVTAIVVLAFWPVRPLILRFATPVQSRSAHPERDE